MQKPTGITIQGCWMHLLWDGNGTTIIRRSKRPRTTTPHFQKTRNTDRRHLAGNNLQCQILRIPVSFSDLTVLNAVFSFKHYNAESFESIAPRLDHYGRELLLGFLKVS